MADLREVPERRQVFDGSGIEILVSGVGWLKIDVLYVSEARMVRGGDSLQMKWPEGWPDTEIALAIVRRHDER